MKHQFYLLSCRLLLLVAHNGYDERLRSLGVLYEQYQCSMLSFELLAMEQFQDK